MVTLERNPGHGHIFTSVIGKKKRQSFSCRLSFGNLICYVALGRNFSFFGLRCLMPLLKRLFCVLFVMSFEITKSSMVFKHCSTSINYAKITLNSVRVIRCESRSFHPSSMPRAATANSDAAATT